MAADAAKLSASQKLRNLRCDASGSVDDETFERLFKEVMRGDVSFDVRAMLSKAPRNSDGRIILEQFLAWLFPSTDDSAADGKPEACQKLRAGIKADSSGAVDEELLKKLLRDVFTSDQSSFDLDALLAKAPRNSENKILLDAFLSWIFDSPARNPACNQDLSFEDGVQNGSWVVGRLSDTEPAEYVYAQIDSLDPFRAHSADGRILSRADLVWAVVAKDDGWLEPFGDQWREPGRVIFLRLLKNNEWVSARVADVEAGECSDKNSIYLPLKGVDGLDGVNVQEDVGLLFTPHEECVEEFANVQPTRGGSLVSHLSNAFVKLEDKLEARRRWVEKGRVEIQYPMRCVWVNPLVKQQGLQEFASRCQARVAQRREEGEVDPDPEVVLVLGPPAAGKSSIERLPTDDVPEGVRNTVSSLGGREEVNNDNLTDCMPGFSEEFQVAIGLQESPTPSGMTMRGKGLLRMTATPTGFSKQSSLDAATPTGFSKRFSLDSLSPRSPSSKNKLFETMKGIDLAASFRDIGKQCRRQNSTTAGWAMQWLTYAFFHHGPVRDSLAWDIIKVTIVDAADLPVYYSSVMAGNAISRTVHIVDLGRSKREPVPHPPLRTVGFWPYTSQEARIARQKKRHADERTNKKLLGGNADSNMVNLHYHASQAEANILNMLKALEKQEDEGYGNGVEHFLIIDNGGNVPRVLFDWAAAANDEYSSTLERQFKTEITTAVKAMLAIVNEVSPWNSLCNHVHRIAQFFLTELKQEDDELLKIAGGKKTHKERVVEADELLPLLTKADEAVFSRLNKAPVLPSDFAHLHKISLDITVRGYEMLASISMEDAAELKKQLSELRKFCVVFAMDDIRDDSDESSADSDDLSDSGRMDLDTIIELPEFGMPEFGMESDPLGCTLNLKGAVFGSTLKLG